MDRINNIRLGGILALLLFSIAVYSQEKPVEWDLETCIRYAREQNIQIRQSRIALEESLENTKEAKAQLFPALAFSTSHNYTNRPFSEINDKNSYNGSYDLSASVSLYQGGKLRKNLQQQHLLDEVQELTIKESENNIQLAVTQAFIQVLYAEETVKINENTVEVSKVQQDRGKELMLAGALSQADFARLQSQYTTDKYQLVVAQANLENVKIELKQLLELGIQDEMKLLVPDLSGEEFMSALPSKESIYLTSLGIMPEIKYNQLKMSVAGIEKEKARTAYLPDLRLSAGIGTGHAAKSSWSWGTQVKQNWSESVGLTLSIPIFSNRAAKTAVNLAQLNIENVELGYESVQKDLLKSIETVYQDVVSAQNRFRSARENLTAVELSFGLTQEQFFLGMKNTLEMLTEKNNLQTARQEMVQSKYMAILNLQLLSFYQGKQIKL